MTMTRFEGSVTALTLAPAGLHRAVGYVCNQMHPEAGRYATVEPVAVLVALAVGEPDIADTQLMALTWNEYADHWNNELGAPDLQTLRPTYEQAMHDAEQFLLHAVASTRVATHKLPTHNAVLFAELDADVDGIFS